MTKKFRRESRWNDWSNSEGHRFRLRRLLGLIKSPLLDSGLVCNYSRHNRDVASTDVAPVVVDKPGTDETTSPDHPWIVIVWNDPINLMSYVTFVLQKLFGYSREKATELMLDVHHKGRAVVSTGERERAEIDVYRLHEHGLWATMQKDSAS